MNYISIYWFGWYKDDNSDKVWGVLEVDNSFYSFYGKRGTTEEDLKKLKFTKIDNKFLAVSKIEQKKNKGYLETYDSVYPGFKEHLEQEMFYERLSGNV